MCVFVCVCVNKIGVVHNLMCGSDRGGRDICEREICEHVYMYMYM